MTEDIDQVQRTADALKDDWFRCDEILTRVQVDKLFFKRGLSPDQCIAVEKILRDANITIVEEEPEKGDNEEKVAAEAEDLNAGERDIFELFMHDMRKHKLLKDDEVHACARSLKLYDDAKAANDAGQYSGTYDELEALQRRALTAKSKLICCNLGLVLKVANQFRKRAGSLDYLDLIQEGVFGLAKAAEKFDPNFGTKFSTYAIWWIRQSVYRGVDDTGEMIRVPIHAKESVRKLRRAIHAIKSSKGYEPNSKQLSDFLNWPLDKTAFLMSLLDLKVLSLDAPVGDEGDDEMIDYVPSPSDDPEELYAKKELKKKINNMLALLTPREALIIQRRFGLVDGRDATLEQIGQQLNVTRERIRQIEAKTLKKLHRVAKKEKLNHFIGYDANAKERAGRDSEGGTAVKDEDTTTAKIIHTVEMYDTVTVLFIGVVKREKKVYTLVPNARGLGSGYINFTSPLGQLLQGKRTNARFPIDIIGGCNEAKIISVKKGR